MTHQPKEIPMPLLTTETFKDLIGVATQEALLILEHKPRVADRANIRRYRSSLAQLDQLTARLLAELEAKFEEPATPDILPSELSDEGVRTIAAAITTKINELTFQLGKIQALALKINKFEECADADPEKITSEPRNKLNILKVAYNDLKTLPLARILALCSLIEAAIIPTEIRLKTWHLVLISLIAIGATIATGGALAPAAIAATGVTIGAIGASAAAAATGGFVFAAGKSIGLRALGKRESAETIAKRIAWGFGGGLAFGAIGGAVAVVAAPTIIATVPSALGVKILTGATAGAAGTGARSVCIEATKGYDAIRRGEKVDLLGAATRILASTAIGALVGGTAGAAVHAFTPSTTSSTTETTPKTPASLLQHTPIQVTASATSVAHEGGTSAFMGTIEDLTPEETELAKQVAESRIAIATIIAEGGPTDPIAAAKKRIAVLAAIEIDDEDPAAPRTLATTLASLHSDSEEDDDAASALASLPPRARAAGIFLRISHSTASATPAPV